MKTIIYNIGTLAGILPEGTLKLEGSEMNHVECIEDAYVVIEDGVIKSSGIVLQVRESRTVLPPWPQGEGPAAMLWEGSFWTPVPAGQTVHQMVQTSTSTPKEES